MIFKFFFVLVKLYKMVRRRSASPKPSAPVRKVSPPTVGSRNTYSSNSTPATHGGGGGFMSQLAATAGGVAIGSVVGHSVVYFNFKF